MIPDPRRHTVDTYRGPSVCGRDGAALSFHGDLLITDILHLLRAGW